MKVGNLLEELKDYDKDTDILFLEFVNEKPRVRIIDGLHHCEMKFLDGVCEGYILLEAGYGSSV